MNLQEVVLEKARKLKVEGAGGVGLGAVGGEGGAAGVLTGGHRRRARAVEGGEAVLRERDEVGKRHDADPIKPAGSVLG